MGSNALNRPHQQTIAPHDWYGGYLIGTTNRQLHPNNNFPNLATGSRSSMPSISSQIRREKAAMSHTSAYSRHSIPERLSDLTPRAEALEALATSSSSGCTPGERQTPSSAKSPDRTQARLPQPVSPKLPSGSVNNQAASTPEQGPMVSNHASAESCSRAVANRIRATEETQAALQATRDAEIESLKTYDLELQELQNQLAAVEGIKLKKAEDVELTDRKVLVFLLEDILKHLEQKDYVEEIPSIAATSESFARVWTIMIEAHKKRISVEKSNLRNYTASIDTDELNLQKLRNQIAAVKHDKAKKETVVMDINFELELVAESMKSLREKLGGNEA